MARFRFSQMLLLTQLQVLETLESHQWPPSTDFSSFSFLRNLLVDRVSHSTVETIFSLTNLEHLQLWNSTLLGSLPSEIGLLDKLTLVGLVSLAGVTTSVPSQIGRLSLLEQFVIRDVRFRGEGNSGVPNICFAGLEDLFLGISISSFLFDRIFFVVVVFCSVVSISPQGTLPTQIALLTSLTLLSLAETDLEGRYPDEFDDLPEVCCFESQSMVAKTRISTHTSIHKTTPTVPKYMHTVGGAMRLKWARKRPLRANLSDLPGHARVCCHDHHRDHLCHASCCRHCHSHLCQQSKRERTATARATSNGATRRRRRREGGGGKGVEGEAGSFGSGWCAVHLPWFAILRVDDVGRHSRLPVIGVQGSSSDSKTRDHHHLLCSCPFDNLGCWFMGLFCVTSLSPSPFRHNTVVFSSLFRWHSSCFLSG